MWHWCDVVCSICQLMWAGLVIDRTTISLPVPAFLWSNLHIFNSKEKYAGFAMGGPLSAIMSSIVMQDLEAKAIDTASKQCGLSFWKRYVNDTLEKIKIGHTRTYRPPELNRQDWKYEMYTWRWKRQIHFFLRYEHLKWTWRENKNQNTLKTNTHRSESFMDTRTPHRTQTVCGTLFHWASMVTDRKEEEEHMILDATSQDGRSIEKNIK